MAWLALHLPAAIAAPGAQADTPTPPDLRVEIFQDVNVRAGPGTDYDLVGVLIPGQTSAILGRSSDSTWIKITYVGGPDNSGWVLRDLVRVIGELPSIPTVVAPPTPTLPPTRTPEPGATSAGFNVEATASRYLPTFTAPAPAVRPTLLPVQGTRASIAFPPAILIIVLFVLGAFGGLVSLLRLRQ
jgi:hypothetical protein